MHVILGRCRRVRAGTVSKDPPDWPARSAEAIRSEASSSHDSRVVPHARATDRLPRAFGPGNAGDPSARRGACGTLPARDDIVF
jgi:hypothetical protein